MYLRAFIIGSISYAEHKDKFFKELNRMCDEEDLYIITSDLKVEITTNLYKGKIIAGEVVDGYLREEEYFVQEEESGGVKIIPVWQGYNDGIIKFGD